jgi:photosystem II stability/assembly factor-like uncharacterized protein
VALNDKDETVSAFVIAKKGRIVAGTSAGILLSDDKGQTWCAANINPNDKAAVFSLTVDASGTVYAGLSRYGVLVSEDNGDSWKLYNTGLNKGGPRSSYAMLASGNNILKGTFESGVYLSPDKGKTWQPSNNGIPLNLIDNKMVSVSQLVQNDKTVYALTDLGVRYSNDKGKTWSKPVHNGIERLGYMQSLAVYKNNLFTGIGTSQKGVFLSTDNGENWKPAGLKDKAVSALFIAANGIVYAGAEGEISRSADNGKTWTAIGTGLPAKSAVYAIGMTPDGKLLAGINRKGIYLLK